MKKKDSDPSENLFMWSAGGIKQVQQPGGADDTSESDEKEPVESSDDERRDYARLDLKLPILYKVIGRGDSHIPAAVRPYLAAQSDNISAVGLCLTLEEKLPLGSVLELSIHWVEKRQKYNALGRVVWARPADKPHHFLTGIKIVVVEDNSIVLEKQSQIRNLLHVVE